MPFHYTVDTGYGFIDDWGNSLRLLRAYVGTVFDTELIEVDIDQHFWPEIARTRYDGISYEPAGIIGIYSDATPENSSSLTQPWFVVGDGALNDNLWAFRETLNTPAHGYGDHGINHNVFEAFGRMYEDTPIFTTSVGVPLGTYAVYGYYWTGNTYHWGVAMGLSGGELANYDYNADDTGVRSSIGNALMRAPIGIRANVSQISVDVGQHSYTSEIERGRFDGISYQPINLTGVYVDATEDNTVLKDDPGGTWLGDQGYFDDLWEKRIGYGIDGTVFEGGPLANDPENLWEDVPVITTSTPVPQGTYKVYVYFWSEATVPLGLQAAISGQPLTQFTPSNSELIATLGSRHLMRALLGIVNATDQISVDVDGIEGPFWTRSWYDGIGYEEETIQTVPLSEAKTLADGAAVKVDDLVVSAVFGDIFYAQTAKRTAGIRVRKPGHGVAVGDVVDVQGTMATDVTTGERYIDAAGGSISATAGTPPAPLGMINKALGGDDFGTPPAGQPGVSGGVGLNNVGLFVRTTGSVLDQIVDGFIVNDGSGVPLRVVYTQGMAPEIGDYVIVTGISSLELVGSNLQRLILATGWDKVDFD